MDVTAVLINVLVVVSPAPRNGIIVVVLVLIDAYLIVILVLAVVMIIMMSLAGAIGFLVVVEDAELEMESNV